ncbi:MAG TPA: glycosyltransferase family 39 protein [Acidimicrobiales bacterium]|nr:glycosyltransferase family 39 protein [Acidimicrobiales bacterium]
MATDVARRGWTPGVDAAPKTKVAVAAEPAWIDLGVALVLVGGLVLRFVATSPLWLDETLSVNIAKVPFGDMAGALRQDGAPPLYYVVLKGWMEIFGSSDFAVRAMSGVFAVAALPFLWLTGRRLAGREGAWLAVVLMASSPFALRYATEARMYSLVVLLSAIGVVLLNGFLDKPTTPRMFGLMVVTGALVLTHYWALYLVAALLVVLALRAERAKPYESGSVKFPSSWAMVGIGTGLLAIVPWLPSFLYQVQHTGTPWAGVLGASTPVIAVLSFGGTGTDASSLLGLALVLLALIGAFGRRLDPRVDEKLLLLDLRGSTPGRNIGLLVLATLLLATIVGIITRGAFQPRYAAVVLVPFLLLVALGASNIGAVKLRRGVVAVVAGLGLLVGTAGADQERTQAGEIAAVLATRARANDLVVYCPDQLGPAVARRLEGLGHGDRLRQVTYPDLQRPTLIDWVDYAERMKESDPERLAQRVHQRAAGFTVWLVWSSSYRAVSGKCGLLNAHLNNVRPRWRNVLTASATGSAESANLTVYPPG